METRVLFRPVGPREGKLILLGGRFPRRLVEQPIFYPVLEREYARMIARQWNAQSDSQAGFVTEFDVDASFLERYPEQLAGGSICRELWVPSEELGELNAHIAGPIRFVDAFYGERYRGPIPRSTVLAGLDAREQLEMLTILADERGLGLEDAVLGCPVQVQLNFAFWVEVAEPGPASVLEAVVRAWRDGGGGRLLGEEGLHPRR